jgi:hypothetical protein
MRPGIKLLEDVPGSGPVVERQRLYRLRFRMWLNKGDAVRWKAKWGQIDTAVLEDDGATLITDVRINREALISGLLYGVEGMRVGGTRKLKVSPHMAFGERGTFSVIRSARIWRCAMHRRERFRN